MSAVVICTTKATCLPVLCASLSFYLPTYWTVYLAGSNIVLPRHRTINLPNTAKNFGDAYNAAVHEAMQEHEDLLVLNDDVVFTPHTWRTLVEDLSIIPEENRGWVACRSDFARGSQNIRYRHDKDQNGENRNRSESLIIKTNIIAPYAAYIHRDAWIDFPPLNWFSDDIQCLDMIDKGLQNYISRSYVHHVGSQTCGEDFQSCQNEAFPWIAENRPELAAKWFPDKLKTS